MPASSAPGDVTIGHQAQAQDVTSDALYATEADRYVLENSGFQTYAVDAQLPISGASTSLFEENLGFSALPPGSSSTNQPNATRESIQYIPPFLEHSTLIVPIPQILSVIPLSGPLLGGVEVAVFGRNFSQYHRCVFGASPATTIFSNGEVIRCLLPPSAAPRRVIVSIEGFPITVGGGVGASGMEELQWFEYIGTDEVDL